MAVDLPVLRTLYDHIAAGDGVRRPVIPVNPGLVGGVDRVHVQRAVLDPGEVDEEVRQAEQDRDEEEYSVVPVEAALEQVAEAPLGVPDGRRPVNEDSGQEGKREDVMPSLPRGVQDVGRVDLVLRRAEVQGEGETGHERADLEPVAPDPVGGGADRHLVVEDEQGSRHQERQDDQVTLPGGRVLVRQGERPLAGVDVQPELVHEGGTDQEHADHVEVVAVGQAHQEEPADQGGYQNSDEPPWHWI